MTINRPPGWIRLFLWYHCTTTPPPGPDNMVREWTDDMFAEGLIIVAEEPGTYTTSERGIAYAELLCSTPFPISRWIDPRQEY